MSDGPVHGGGDATDLPVPLSDEAQRIRRRLVRIQLVLGGLAVLAVIIVVLVGVFGIGVFSHRALGS